MPGTSRSIIIDVSPKIVYDVVTDFESYPDFLDDIREVTIISKTGKKARVSYAIKVIKTIHYTLDYQLTSPKSVVWSFVEGNLFKDCKGSWKLDEIEPGVTEATYELDIDFNLFVPKRLTNMVAGSNLPKMMENFKQRAEARA
jgi:coenzyme Q-binding protein COQ10